MNPRIVMMLSAVLMIIASGMMVGQREWVMLAVVLPIWLIILGVWWYRQRAR
ncbi:hypothetical protein [Gordonia neofelifaecis]|uniref:Uncharacterized protein n=1 Tax=Gordonia neofelifaecis NRRL B-59395 TaxID=644548 RepID=F1YDW6_9ACTN|nr:hypothetical protein [Gordonia neofelifaecis]EGD57056.1 hypothetical protein SCNU_01730 [Gordonia neofelifaecis NRRL B-59395]